MIPPGSPRDASVSKARSDEAEFVTIITVVRNDAAGLTRTLQSIASQCYRNRATIVIDGASGTDTQLVLDRHSSEIDILVSETDHGIYDGMNKGLRLATSEWVIFMNAGDSFSNADALTEAMVSADENVDVVYSDVVFQRGVLQECVRCDLRVRRIHHQCVIYRRSLHQRFGDYLEAPGVTISDYVFFNLIAGQRWVKIEQPIAICDVTGVSSRPMSYYQKLAVDLIFGNRGPQVIGIMLLVYPFYRLLIRPFVRLFQRAAFR